MDKGVRAIALFTDFGPFDHYLGQMRAVLHRSVSAILVYDLMCNAPRFNPRAAAYLLAAILEDLPSGTLVLAVVDPGVGSVRQALMVQTGRHLLIGPDNGLLTIAAGRADEARVSRIDWRPERLSASFQGWDLFAPVAARLVNGEPFAASLLATQTMAGKDWPMDLVEVIHVDVYGNLITGMRASRLDCADRVVAGDHCLSGARIFSDVPPGECFWYENSSGLVEIACNQGSAAERLGLAVGACFEIRAGAAR